LDGFELKTVAKASQRCFFLKSAILSVILKVDVDANFTEFTEEPFSKSLFAIQANVHLKIFIFE